MAGITAEGVWRAADELYAGGRWPTKEMVREALGDTGSATTIQKYLSEWREKLPERAGQLVIPNAPEVITGLMRQLWSQAMAAAQALVEAERVAPLEEQINQLQVQVQQLDATNIRLARERAAIDGALKTAQEQVTSRQMALDAAREEAAAERGRHEQSLGQIAGLEQRLKAAGEEMAIAARAHEAALALAYQRGEATENRLTALLEQERKEKQQAIDQAIVLQGERVELNATLTRQGREAERLRAQMEAAHALSANQREEVDRLNQRIDTLQDAISAQGRQPTTSPGAVRRRPLIQPRGRGRS